MATTQLHRQLHDWFTQRCIRANFKNRPGALADIQNRFFKPWQVIRPGWLHKTKTTRIKLLLLRPQKIDFQVHPLTQSWLTAQFAKADCQHFTRQGKHQNWQGIAKSNAIQRNSSK